MRSIVVAYSSNRVIGRRGELPWGNKMPGDLEHFKALTEGKSVIMGRSTYESLPERFRPLPNRQNIVLSLSQKAINGVLLATSLGDAYSQADNESMVIGGAKVYEQALPTVDRVYATEINTTIDNGDAFFPILNPEEWELVERTPSDDARNLFPSSFATYMRRNNS